MAAAAPLRAQRRVLHSRLTYIDVLLPSPCCCAALLPPKRSTAWRSTARAGCAIWVGHSDVQVYNKLLRTAAVVPAPLEVVHEQGFMRASSLPLAAHPPRPSDGI